MIEHGLFPEDISAYLNSHPIFNQDKGIADENVFHYTNMGNLAFALIYHDAEKPDYIRSQYDIAKEDCLKVTDTLRAARSFVPKDKNNLTTENATVFPRTTEIFYQEHYKKPSEFQFPQETVTLQDEEDLIV